MQNKRSDYFKRKLQEKKRRQNWRKVVLCFSCIVVFCTVYALILPALTLERKTTCGLEEHVHTEACYDAATGELICGKEEHQHDDSCYSREDTGSEFKESDGGESDSGKSNNKTSSDQSTGQKVDQTADQASSGQTATSQAEAQNGENSENTESSKSTEAVGTTGNAAPESNTSSDGFDLSADQTDKIHDVKLYYLKDAAKDQWEEIVSGASGSGQKIPGDAKLKLSVEYKNIEISDLLDRYNRKLTYDLPDFLRNAKAEGNIMDGQTVVGQVNIVNNKIVLTFAEDYLIQLKNDKNETIAGTFYASGNANLSQWGTDGKKTITIAGKDYVLDFGKNPVAQYGQVNVSKSCTSAKVISVGNDNYISYTITVTAGEDGSPDVSVVDQFKTNQGYVSYVDISSTSAVLSGQEDGQKPYETLEEGKQHGSIYLGNLPTDGSEIPAEGAESITAPGSLVWKIGDMSPNESRTLTYFVKLKDDQNLNTIGSVKNHADVYSMTYKKSYSEADFTPRFGCDTRKDMTKSTQNADGTYTLDYEIKFTSKADTSNYPVKGFVIHDYLDHQRKATDSRALPYISYKKDTVKLYVKKSGDAQEALVDPTDYTIEWAENEKSFAIKVKDPVNPGDSYYVRYQISVKPEAIAAVNSNILTVNNRQIVSASNVQNKLGDGFEAWSNSSTITYNGWDTKSMGAKTTQDQTITMTGERYEAGSTAGSVKKDTSDTTQFTVPAGSYPYTVTVNGHGDWDMTQVEMKDQLSSQYMQYVGYVKIEAYDAGAANESSEALPKQTKWVKIDGLNSFVLKPSDLGWEEKSYAYRFTYYAHPVNTDAFSEVIVNNTFRLDGNVVRDGKTYEIENLLSRTEVKISGNYSMNVKKSSWYYEEPVTGEDTWTKGKIYWVIEVAGTAVKKDTAIRDSIAQGSGVTDSYLHSDSLVGIYKGKLADDKSVTGFSSLEEFTGTDGIQNVTTKFSSELTNNKKFKGSDQYSELTVTAKEQITLGDEKLYLVVRSEPASLPAAGRDTRTFKNGVSTSDNHTDWLDRGTAEKTLTAGGDVLKELGQTFTYDGTDIVKKENGKDNGDISKIVKDELPGAGLYASWAFKLNYAGELSGQYRALENIPDGMEFAYIRIKWRGDGAGKVHSCEINDLPEGWTKRQMTAKMDSGGSITTTSYVKGNQVLIALDGFAVNEAVDKGSVDVQVVCRVTNPDVLLGGETKTFTNQVILQTKDGREISSATAPATMTMEKLTKSATESYEKVTFTIKTNQLGQKLPTGEGTTKLKLIDQLSSTLILDPSTIQVVNSRDYTAVDFNASMKENNTLELELPCDVPLTITYTATVNAPPGQTVSFTNNAYWEGYTPSSGASAGKNNYSYSAGGTASAGTNIKLKIAKKDQNNLTQGLSGAVFEVVRCTLQENGEIVKDSGSPTWSGTTGDDGTLTLGATGASQDGKDLLYNTLYEVRETTAPEGYVLESQPYYIMVPKKQNNETDYSEYVKRCMNDSRIQVQYQSTYELNVSNHRGEITVEKYFKDAGGHDSNPVSGTYWFGLYENAEGTGDPVKKISITYRAESTEIQKATFTDLALDKIYYVFELDDNGKPVTDGSKVSSISGMEYFTSYDTVKSDASEVEGNEAANGDLVKITNQSRVQKLPSTGSCGTLLYRLAGVVLIFLAGILVLKKFKTEEKK